MTAVRPPISSPDLAPFTCEVAPWRDAVHVIPAGEMDIATTPVVAEHLDELRDAGFARIVLDLRRLSFLDATGLALVLSWSAASADHGGRTFQVIPGPPLVQRIFDLTGTAERVDFCGGPPDGDGPVDRFSARRRRALAERRQRLA